MPLQGLDGNTKVVVLQRLIKGQCSLKDLQATYSSIKKKKKFKWHFVSTLVKPHGRQSWLDFQITPRKRN